MAKTLSCKIVQTPDKSVAPIGLDGRWDNDGTHQQRPYCRWPIYVSPGPPHARNGIGLAAARTMMRTIATVAVLIVLGLQDLTSKSQEEMRGILWSAPHVFTRFGSRLTDTLTPTGTAEDFMSRFVGNRRTVDGHASKEIPFSGASKMALGRAAEEADELGHKAIRTEHLLLGILRDESSEAWGTLNEAGVTLGETRRIMREEPNEQS